MRFTTILLLAIQSLCVKSARCANMREQTDCAQFISNMNDADKTMLATMYAAYEQLCEQTAGCADLYQSFVTKVLQKWVAKNVAFIYNIKQVNSDKINTIEAEKMIKDFVAAKNAFYKNQNIGINKRQHFDNHFAIFASYLRYVGKTFENYKTDLQKEQENKKNSKTCESFESKQEKTECSSDIDDFVLVDLQGNIVNDSQISKNAEKNTNTLDQMQQSMLVSDEDDTMFLQRLDNVFDAFDNEKS